MNLLVLRTHLLVEIEESVESEDVDDHHLSGSEAESGVGESNLNVDEIADAVEIGGLGVVVVAVPVGEN